MADTLCFARETELESLNSLYNGLLEGRSGTAVISGEAGAGKSTLIRRFLDDVDDQCVIATGQTPAIGESAPFAVWIDILHSLTGIRQRAHKTQSESAVEKARSALIELGPDVIELLIPGTGLFLRSTDWIRRKTKLGRSVASRVGISANIDGDRTQLIKTYSQVLQSLAIDQPLILILEDLHRADQYSLMLLQTLLESDNSSILLLMTLRSDHRGSQEGGDKVDVSHIAHWSKSRDFISLDLTSPSSDNEALITALVQHEVANAQTDLAQRILKQSDGNPLFALELVKKVKSTGSLDEALPDELSNAFALRFAELDREEQEILRVASVVGEKFSVEMLATVLGKSKPELVRSLSTGLSRDHGLVDVVGTSEFFGNRMGEYRFHHNLFQRYVYDSLDSLERVYLHEAVAEALNGFAGEYSAEVAHTLAHHFHAAERNDDASDWYLQAGLRDRDVYALDSEIEFLRKSLALAPDHSEARFTALRELSRALSAKGEIDEAEAVIESALSLAADLGANQQNLARLQRAFIHAAKWEIEEARTLCESTLKEVPPDSKIQAETLALLANIESQTGNYDEALDYCKRTEALLESGSDAMGRIKRRLAWILKETGRNADAKVILEERLQQLEADESASWAELALVKIDLSDVYINEERYDLACEGLNDGIRYAEMCQMMENKSIAHSNLANVLNRMGDFENALTHGLASLELDEAYFEGEHPALAFPLCCVGESLIGAGRPDEALPHLQRAFDIRQAAEVPAGNLAWSQWLLGRAQTESGNRTDGIANVMQARKAFEAMEDSISTELRDLREWLAENA